MSFDKVPNKESLYKTIAKLLDVLNEPENNENTINSINAMLDGLLQKLKNTTSENNIPNPNDDSKPEQPKKQAKCKFDYKNSNAYKKLTGFYFYPTIRHSELVSIATAIAERCDKLSVAREVKRRKDLLFEWYDSNWEIVEPHLKCIEVYNKDNKKLNGCGRQDSQSQNSVSDDEE